MEKHVALVFLSDFKIKKEMKDEIKDNKLTGEKVATGRILLENENEYYGKDGFAVKGRHTNEPALYYLLKKYGQLDRIFIFASEKVRSSFNYVDEQGIEHNSDQDTQIQLFENIIIAKYAQMTGMQLPREVFEIVAYEEPAIKSKDDYRNWSYDSNNADFASILEMASKVKLYSDKVKTTAGKDVQVHLHVDMTGGFRHANMLMLAVVDLLKYSGLQVDDIIYTNFDRNKHVGKIEEVTNIHNIFRLVAGAEEFVRYGSVESLQRYFDKLCTSSALDELLKSMKNFADVLKLCRAGMIKNAIENLKESIDNYKKKIINKADIIISEEEKVFGELLVTIEEKYAPVFIVNNETNIISWCMENGFIQQALTFFTELVPQTIFDSKILYTEDQKIIAQCEKNKADYVPTAKYFLLNYNPISDEPAEKAFTNSHGIVNEFRKIYSGMDSRKQAEAGKTFLASAPQAVGAVYRRLTLELEKNTEARFMLKISNNLAQIRKKYPCLCKAAYFTYRVNAQKPSDNDFSQKWMLRIDADKIRKYFASISYENACDLLELCQSESIGNSNEAVPKKRKKLFVKSMKRRNQIISMLEAKTIKTNFINEAAADRVYDYYKICELRNMVNHANAEEEIENADIIDEIKNAIENLQDTLQKSRMR